jgi:ribosomal protein L37AE/L43A
MNCSYCGRRVPGRLVIQGIKKCQGCGAKLPEPDWKNVVITDSGTDYDVTLHMLINQRTGVVIVYKETINAPFQNGKV